MRYRRIIRGQVINSQRAGWTDPMLIDLRDFMSALLTSMLPLETQLEHVLRQDDIQMLEHAIHVGARLLRIASLAPAMIHVYNTTTDEDLRVDVIQNLGYLNHDQAHQLLLHVLQHHSSTQLRAMAAYAFQNGKRPDAVAPLLAIAQNPSEDPILRGQAIEGLAYQGDESLVPLILPFLQHEEAIIRWGALHAVGRLGNLSYTSFIEPLLSDTTVVDASLSSIAEDARHVLDRWAAMAEGS